MRPLTLICLTFLSLLLSGCASRPPRDVSLSVTSATIQPSGNYYLITCEAVLNNRTGTPLSVESQFHSAFDNLRLVIYDEQDQLLHDGDRSGKDGLVYDHRSPYSLLPQKFTLPPGRSSKSVNFVLPVTLFPVSSYTVPNVPSVKVLLIGTLPGSGYHNPVKSSAIRATASANETAATSPTYFWQTPAR